jgi:hypothetical protein
MNVNSFPKASELIWVDPRTEIQVGVMMADGRLAPRTFATRAEAEAWAQDGEEVVEWNLVCDCDM